MQGNRTLNPFKNSTEEVICGSETVLVASIFYTERLKIRVTHSLPSRSLWQINGHHKCQGGVIYKMGGSPTMQHQTPKKATDASFLFKG